MSPELGYIASMDINTDNFGSTLKFWRNRRSLSQLELSVDADISQRHLSFLESGRSKPSRDMVLNLASQLDVPLRDRNLMLAKAGFAPIYVDRPQADSAIEATYKAVEKFLEAQEPYPALAIDRHWNLIFANSAVSLLMSGVDEALLSPSINVLRLSLHPDGLASRIVNYREWRHHVLSRLAKQIDASGDGQLAQLENELREYPVPANAFPWIPNSSTQSGGIAITLEIATPKGNLRLLSATTVFGTALDIGLSELAIESFFPADRATARILLSAIAAS
jgi:transcriptional regulator with XRE-family HTH domain